MPRNKWNKQFWTGSLLGLTPEAERRWRRRTLIVLAWLCIGAVVNVLVAWGCVWYGETFKWKKVVSTGAQWLEEASSETVAWPTNVNHSWREPINGERLQTRGYRRESARYVETTEETTRAKPVDDGVPGSRARQAIEEFEKRNLPLYERHHGYTGVSTHFDPIMWHPTPEAFMFVVKFQSTHILREAFATRAGWPLPTVHSFATQTLISKAGYTRFVQAQVGVGPHMNPDAPRAPTDILDGGIMPDSMLPTSPAGPRTWTFPVRPIWSGFVLNTLFFAAIDWSIVRAFLSSLWFMIRRRRRRRGLCVACAYPVHGLPICPECGSARE